MDTVMSDFKEVYFHTYCPLCKYEDKQGDEEPCDECMTHFFNVHSHKPVKFEKKDERSGSV